MEKKKGRPHGLPSIDTFITLATGYNNINKISNKNNMLLTNTNNEFLFPEAGIVYFQSINIGNGELWL
jgi:hypothetical protein